MREIARAMAALLWSSLMPSVAEFKNCATRAQSM
jgi:hypothetical protein